VYKDNFKLFFQSGAGLILFADNYPKPSGFFGDNREGTKLNGSPKYGFGTEFNLSKQFSAQAGFWHVHFSNGDNPSYERNPGHDSNGFSVGLVYKH
jgi:opacity protein-like surface antigen